MTTGRDRLAPLSLRANFAWVLLGQSVYSGSQLGVLVVIARLADQATVGRFALGLVIAAPVFRFAHLRLQTVQATDATREFEFNTYLGLQLVLIPLAMMVVAAVVLSAGLGSATGAVVLMVGLAKAIENLGLVFHGLYQQRHRMDRSAGSQAVRGIGGLGAFALALWTTGSLLWGILALTLARLLALFFYDLPVAWKLLADPHEEEASRRSLRPTWDRATLTSLAWLALPAGVAAAIAQITLSMPTYLIAGFLDEAAVGLFAAVAVVLRVFDLLSAGLGRAAIPRLAEYHARGANAEFSSLVLRLVVWSAGIGALGFFLAQLVGDRLLLVIFGTGYGRGDLLARLVIAGALMVVARVLGGAIVSTRQFKLEAMVVLVTLVPVGLGGWWLVSSRGIEGAAETLILGFGFRSILSGLVLWRHGRSTSWSDPSGERIGDR